MATSSTASADYHSSPAMFRNKPLGFILAVILIPAFGAGILILLFWYVKTNSIKLTIRGSEVHLERGLLSKEHTDIDLNKIRSVNVRQRFWQRVFGVGTIEVHTVGDTAAFVLDGMPEPNRIRELIKGRLATTEARRS